MPDHEKPNARGLFGGVFARGGVEAGDAAWLRAMLDAEAGLARALERAGLAPAGAGEAVTAAARAGNFDPNELGGLAALTGNPVPGLARALARQVPQTAVSAVHRGATSQDIVDTAAMLLAKRAIRVIAGRPGPGGRRRGRAGRGAPGLDHDRPDPAPAGRPRDLRAGRGGLADQPGRGPRRVGRRRSAARGPVRRRGGHARLARRGRPAGHRAARHRTRPGRAGAALAHGPAADHRPGRRAGPGRGGARQDRAGCHPAGPVGGRRGQRGRRCG